MSAVPRETGAAPAGVGTRDRLTSLVRRFADRSVLVLGDLVLDEYLVGRASRLSREAPIPVLELVERFSRPGAAANPAANVAALGGRPSLVGVVGMDPPGEALCAELGRLGIDVGGVIRSPARATATKTRVMAQHAAAHGQQVARIDHVPNGPLDEATAGALLAQIDAAISTTSAVLLSDYKAGVVCPETIQAVATAARRAGVPVAVDTQGDPYRFRGFTLVKLNQPDAEAALARRLTNDQELAEAGRRLQAEIDARVVAITRGAEGMSIVMPDGQHTHVPPENRTEVWDVTGAGDTVIAVLTLGLAAGGDILDAARLANAAAGLVVRQIGVATVAPDELIAAIGHARTA